MRRIAVLALAVLASCATTGSLPGPRYADAASRGSVATFFAGSPSQEEIDRATENWTNALGDSFACRAPTRPIIDAGLVGALEIGAMNAAARKGGEDEIKRGVGTYLGRVLKLAVENRPTPSPARCEALVRWAPAVAEQGRESVARARKNGMIGREYDLMLGLAGF